VRSLAAALLFTFVFVLPASAQDARRARALFEEGVAAASAESWTEAVDKFRQSFALVERPATAFNLAIALDRLGLISEANAALDDYFRVAPRNDPRRADATALRNDLASRTPIELTLTVAPDDAIVEVDGRVQEGSGSERTVAIPPGAHTVTVRAEGHTTEMIQIDAVAGEPLARAVELAVQTQGRGPAERARGGGGGDPLPWVVVGASAAVLVAGVVLLAVGRVDAATVEDAPLGTPYEDVREAAERSPILSTTGIVLMAVGAIGTALGIVWAVQTPSGGEVAFTPSGVRGSF
jgi:hypothetical protein